MNQLHRTRLINALRNVDYKMERPPYIVSMFNKFINCFRMVCCHETTPTDVYNITIKNIDPLELKFIQDLALDAGCAVEVSSKKKTIKIFYLPENSVIHLALENKLSEVSIREIPIDDISGQQPHDNDMAKKD